MSGTPSRLEVDRAFAAAPSAIFEVLRSPDGHVVIEPFEPDTEIAWSIDGVMQPPMGHPYGYRLAPIDGGTLVTSYYDWSNLHEQYAGFAERFPSISEAGLHATLGTLARTVAPGKPRPGA